MDTFNSFSNHAAMIFYKNRMMDFKEETMRAYNDGDIDRATRLYQRYANCKARLEQYYNNIVRTRDLQLL